MKILSISLVIMTFSLPGMQDSKESPDMVLQMAHAMKEQTQFEVYQHAVDKSLYSIQSYKIMPDGQRLILGDIMITLGDDKEAEINLFEVDQRFRQMGHGKDLFHFAIEYIYNSGYRTIEWRPQPIYPSIRPLASLVKHYTHFCNTLKRKFTLSTEHQENGSVRMKLLLA